MVKRYLVFANRKYENELPSESIVGQYDDLLEAKYEADLAFDRLAKSSSMRFCEVFDCHQAERVYSKEVDPVTGVRTSDDED